jgi:sugar-specific transcriptional regulator TrmB
MTKTYIASEKSDALILQLLSFDLNYQEATIYVYLLENGANSVWDISQTLKLPRTNIYRCIATLVERGFVIETIVAKTKKYYAQGIEAIEKYINDYEHNLKTIKNKVSDVNDIIFQIRNQETTSYKVFHYQGVEGLKQVNWNSTKAHEELRIIEIQTLTQTTEKDFAENIRKIFADKGTKIKQLTNKTSFKDYTAQKKLVENTQIKHIPPTILDIKAEIQIYNNVVCMYEYKDNNIFIVEIVNDTFSQMYKQIFDSFWSQAILLTNVSPFGEAKILN